MLTSKPLATISYNSREYLKLVLNNLLEAKKIQFWAFIKHKKEEDEEKDHFHVYVEPCTRIDTNALKDCFKEVDSTNKKPLGTLIWRYSQLTDWIYYGLHDSAYLMQKGETRKYHYTTDEIVCSDYSELRNFIIEHPRPKSEADVIIMGLMCGRSNFEIMRDLRTPTYRMRYVSEAIEMYRRDMTYRNNRPNHEYDDLGDIVEENEDVL